MMFALCPHARGRYYRLSGGFYLENVRSTLATGRGDALGACRFRRPVSAFRASPVRVNNEHLGAISPYGIVHDCLKPRVVGCRYATPFWKVRITVSTRPT